MKAVAIDHIVLRVTNLERAVAFYEQLLRCPVVHRQESLGLVHLKIGESLIDLISVEGPLGSAGGRPPANEGRNLDHLCLRVENFDAARVRQELEQAGIEVGPTGERYGSTGEALSIYAKDPDGNGLEFRA